MRIKIHSPGYALKYIAQCESSFTETSLLIQSQISAKPLHSSDDLTLLPYPVSLSLSSRDSNLHVQIIHVELLNYVWINIMNSESIISSMYGHIPRCILSCL